MSGPSFPGTPLVLPSGHMRESLGRLGTRGLSVPPEPSRSGSWRLELAAGLPRCGLRAETSASTGLCWEGASSLRVEGVEGTGALLGTSRARGLLTGGPLCFRFSSDVGAHGRPAHGLCSSAGGWPCRGLSLWPGVPAQSLSSGPGWAVAFLPGVPPGPLWP